MELPTYTSIWRIEKRLYKLYDFRLPMPLPVGQIAVFTAITVPYVVLLTVFGLPFNHNLFWLYVLPPGVLTWLATRPVLESKRLPELVISQVRYLGEPATWCRMTPLSEKDEVVVYGRVWRRAIPAEAVAAGAVAAEAVAAEPAAVRPAVPARALPAAASQAQRPVAVAASRQRTEPASLARYSRPAQNPGRAGQVPLRGTAAALAGQGRGAATPAGQAPARGPAAPGRPAQVRGAAAAAGQAPARSPAAPGRSAQVRGAAGPTGQGQVRGAAAAAGQAPTANTTARPRPASALGYPAVRVRGTAGHSRAPGTAVPTGYPQAKGAEPAGQRPGAPAARPTSPSVRPAPAPTRPTPPSARAAPPTAGPAVSAAGPPVSAAGSTAPAAGPAAAAAGSAAAAAGSAARAQGRTAAAPGSPGAGAGPAGAGSASPAAGVTGGPAAPAPRAQAPVRLVPAQRSVSGPPPARPAPQRPAPEVERVLGGPGQQDQARWRSYVTVVPGGRGPGWPDHEREARARAVLPLDRPRLVVVLGCTVGAGQTVTTLMLADLLASLRGEPVAALDLNPGPASLAVQARIPATAVSAVLARQPGAHAAHGGQAGQAPGVMHRGGSRGRGRLDVICQDAAAEEGGASAGLQQSRLLDLLASRYPLTLADPGASAVAKVLGAADQLVLVAPASADAARAVAMTSEWLGTHGHGALAAHSIAMINGVSRRSVRHAEQAELVLRGRCRAIVRVPWDDHLAEPEAERGIRDSLEAGGGASRLARLHPAVLQAYTALGGVLISALVSGPARRRAAR